MLQSMLSDEVRKEDVMREKEEGIVYTENSKKQLKNVNNH